MTTDREFTRRMVQTVFTVASVAVLCTVVWIARDALMLVYISALIAMGFSPLVSGLERPRHPRGRSRMPRLVAILAIYLSVVAIVMLVGLAVVPPLIAQARDLWAKLPRQFDEFQRFLIRSRLIPREVTLQEAVSNAPAGSGGNAVATVLVAISSVIGGVFGLVTIIILSFYLLVDAEKLFTYLTRFVPAPDRARVGAAAREAVRKVSAWLRAQVILAAVMGVLAAIGLGLLGEPYFYVVALVAAVGETIPVVGPIIGGVTAVAVAIPTSTRLAVTVGIYFVVLHQFEANILVPKVMQRRVGVSPVAVIVALLVGGSLFGVLGAVLAIPTVAILAVILDEFAPGDEPGRDGPPG